MSSSSLPKHICRLCLLLCLVALSACGGGGGGGASGNSGSGSGSSGSSGSSGGTSSGGASAGQPTIAAAVFSFPGGATVGANSGAGVIVENQAGTSPISTATVTVNGVPLTYSTTNADYVGSLNVAPGSAINVSVGIGGADYTVSATQSVKVGLGIGDGYLVVPSGDVVNGWKIVP